MLETLYGLGMDEIVKIDFSEYSIEKLEEFLADVKQREFINQMKDGWTHADFDYNDKCHFAMAQIVKAMGE